MIEELNAAGVREVGFLTHPAHSLCLHAEPHLLLSQERWFFDNKGWCFVESLPPIKLLIYTSFWTTQPPTTFTKLWTRGTCVAQLSIWLLISAQVMISRFVRLSPTSGSALTVWSLLGILSLPLSLPSPVHYLSKINKEALKKKKTQITDKIFK